MIEHTYKMLFERNRTDMAKRGGEVCLLFNRAEKDWDTRKRNRNRKNKPLKTPIVFTHIFIKSITNSLLHYFNIFLFFLFKLLFILSQVFICSVFNVWWTNKNAIESVISSSPDDRARYKYKVWFFYSVH